MSFCIVQLKLSLHQLKTNTSSSLQFLTENHYLLELTTLITEKANQKQPKASVSRSSLITFVIHLPHSSG